MSVRETRYLTGENGETVRVVGPVTAECSYCGTTDCLLMKSDGGESAFGFTITDPLFTCESCFTPQDDGPCFDDLPEVSP